VQNRESIQEFLPPSYIPEPSIQLLQAGKFDTGTDTCVCAIIILKIGKLDCVVENKSQERKPWGELGKATFLPGDSQVICSGEGRLVCFLVLYTKQVEGTSTAVG